MSHNHPYFPSDDVAICLNQLFIIYQIIRLLERDGQEDDEAKKYIVKLHMLMTQKINLA
jgi:hypothetical protein